MANQVATGAGKPLAYGTGAGGSLRMANQVVTGAGNAFAYGAGGGGRSHLAKLRDGVRHCNSALSLSRFCCEFSLGRLRRLCAPPQRESAAKT